MQQSSKTFEMKAGLGFDGGEISWPFQVQSWHLSANLCHCKQSVKACANISEFREKSGIVLGNLLKPRRNSSYFLLFYPIKIKALVFDSRCDDPVWWHLKRTLENSQSLLVQPLNKEFWKKWQQEGLKNHNGENSLSQCNKVQRVRNGRCANSTAAINEKKTNNNRTECEQQEKESRCMKWSVVSKASEKSTVGEMTRDRVH